LQIALRWIIYQLLSIEPSVIYMQTHRVGRPKRGTITTKDPRGIIEKFVIFRDRARVFASKRNLKTFNINKDNEYRIFVSKHLTKRRSNILFAARKLVKERKLDSI
jgi:hypothetical protein